MDPGREREICKAIRENAGNHGWERLFSAAIRENAGNHGRDKKGNPLTEPKAPSGDLYKGRSDLEAGQELELTLLESYAA